MALQFSFIIPVYNRPDELEELLGSLTRQSDQEFEVVVVEDGSENEAEAVVVSYQKQLNLTYLKKDNSGAGMSRNYGMKMATGNYFIILDSDCLLPEKYLREVKKALESHYTPAYGGADASHESFSNFQKAVSYAMTSYLTTGGLRGKKMAPGKFQPRSFNFGISQEAFDKTGGFSSMKIGEDIDLTQRLWKLGFETQFIEKAFVYHKRRTSIPKFFRQTFAFGKGRPVLNRKYPDSKKITYWFPTLFVVGFLLAIALAALGRLELIAVYTFYFVLILLDSLLQNRNVHVAIWSIATTCVQFLGYGLGFINGLFASKSSG